MFYIQQINHDDCGFTALKILLANIYKSKDYLYLKEDESHGGYSFSDLISIAEDYGLHLSGIGVEDDEISLFNNQPMLVSINNPDGNKHLLYLYKVDKWKVYVIDPMIGKKVYKKKDFLSIWDRNALVIEKVDAPKKIESYKNDITLKDKILMYFVSELALVTLFLGVAFVSESINKLIPEIIFFCGFVLEIISQEIIFKKMKKVTNFYVDRMNEIPENKEDFINRLEDYKKIAFTSPLKFLTNLSIIILFIIVMVENSVYNLVSIGVIFIIYVIFYYFVSPFLSKIKYQGDKLEKDLNKSKHIDEFKINLKRANKEAVRYGNNYTTFKAISIFFLLISSIIVMELSNINSTTFLLLNFIFAMLVFDRGMEIINDFDFPNAINQKKAKLINYIK